MKIAIVGTGRMARPLARGWQEAGHTVCLGSRAPQERAPAVGRPIYDVATAVAMAEVVVLAIPYTAVRAFAQQHAGQLLPRLVIDITNPFEHLPDNRIAAAEITANSIGTGARVVTAFKANFWQTLATPIDPATGLVRDVLMAGDAAADKAIVAHLIEDLGFRAIDCGPLRNGRLLDGLVPLIIELDGRFADGEARLAWKLLG